MQVQQLEDSRPGEADPDKKIHQTVGKGSNYTELSVSTQTTVYTEAIPNCGNGMEWSGMEWNGVEWDMLRHPPLERLLGPNKVVCSA